MLSSNDAGHMEYAALMDRSQSLEKTGAVTWTLATTTAVALLVWSVRAGSPGIVLASVFATAAGFLPWMHSRRQTRLIAGYVEEFLESRSNGLQWHARLAQLGSQSVAGDAHEWFVVCLSNLVNLAAVVLAWQYADGTRHGELLAGAATACGVAFAIHSVTETVKVVQTDFVAVWRKATAASRTVAAA